LTNPCLAPVWREAFRVLRPGGTLMTGFSEVSQFSVVLNDVRVGS
jgi:hypothetical protein